MAKVQLILAIFISTMIPLQAMNIATASKDVVRLYQTIAALTY